MIVYDRFGGGGIADQRRESGATMKIGGSPEFRGPLAETFGSPGSIAASLLPPDEALPLAPASDRGVWDADSGSADRATIAELIGRATAEWDGPWPQPLAHQAAGVHRDGDRIGWEAPAFARQRRLSRAAVAAAATLDDRFLDAVADGIVLLCEQSSWCWPAHDDAFARQGWVLADVDDPFLDLGVGEAVAQLAWLDQLLGAQLDARYPGLRSRMRREARRRVFDPFLTRRDWHWLGLDGDVHNWNPWIHGNVIVAALRLLDRSGEEALRAQLVALALEGLDRYVATLPADGAIDEGYGYWWNGACRALEALDLLSQATGRALDAAEVPALRATVAFPHRMHLGGEWYVSFADSPARSADDRPWHALHRAARRVKDREAAALAASHRRPGRPAAREGEGLGRLLLGMTDRAWLDAGPAEAPLVQEVWLPSIQVVIAREHGGSARGLSLAAKGGNNGEHHNHNDVGSVIVASDGVPVIVDPGRPSYTLQTFGADRYAIWTMQSAWHSVPEIRGTAQEAGAGFAARDAAPVGGAHDGGLALDIARAYSVAGLGAWRREARLDRAAREVRITEEWRLEPWPGDHPELATILRLVIAGTTRLGDREGELRVEPLEGATPVLIRWSPEISATLVTRELDDPMLSEVWGPSLTRLDLDVTSHLSATGHGRATVVMTQIQEGTP
jgi:hypothetical protein